MAEIKQRASVHSQYDIAGYSQDRSLVLLGEVKATKDSSPSGAVYFRRNLLSHGLLPSDLYFLFVNRTTAYLWKPSAEPDAPADFSAPSKPIFKKFLDSTAEPHREIGPESLEFAVGHWLNKFANQVESTESQSEADKMLVDSGLSKKLRGGEVRRDFVL